MQAGTGQAEGFSGDSGAPDHACTGVPGWPVVQPSLSPEVLWVSGKVDGLSGQVHFA